LDLFYLIHSQLRTTGNTSTIAILHTLQFTVTHVLGFSVFTSRILATDLSQSHCHFKSRMKSSMHSLIHFLPFRLPSPELDPVIDNNFTQTSQSHIATDGQSVSLGVEPELGLMTRDLLLFDSYGRVCCEAPSLTRGRVCLMYMLLVLASAVLLGSESLWDSQTLSDLRLSFGRPLRLAGSRWRYSTPPPLKHPSLSLYNPSARATQKTASVLLRRLIY
jgi:hypothetical protein